jgi:hypothetical protein
MCQQTAFFDLPPQPPVGYGTSALFNLEDLLSPHVVDLYLNHISHIQIGNHI